MYKKTGRESLTLQAALFATGCAGIVAEFVLSTLATYLIGDAIFQWTIVMSLMLFSMGIGSRLSRYFHSNLLDSFIIIEFGHSGSGVLGGIKVFFQSFLKKQ